MSEIANLPVDPESLFNEACDIQRYLINHDDSYFIKLDTLYRYLDRYEEFVSTFTTCAKGCAYCCHMDVSITRLEAEYIAVKANIPFLADHPATNGHSGHACTFLNNQLQCSIYPYRPFICRAYHSVSNPALCADFSARPGLFATPVDDYKQAPIYRNMYLWIVHANLAAMNERAAAKNDLKALTSQLFISGVMKDIRDFFPG